MTVIILIKRNIKLFFKDKGMFFTSLITPVILFLEKYTGKALLQEYLRMLIYQRALLTDW